MSKKLPNIDDIVDFLGNEPTSIKEIMQAFNIPNSLKSKLRDFLFDYMDSGIIVKNDSGLFSANKDNKLAPKTMALKIVNYNQEGYFIAKSDEKGFESADFIINTPARGTYNIGDTVLAHVRFLSNNTFETRVIRVTLSSKNPTSSTVGIAKLKGDRYEFLSFERTATPVPLMIGSQKPNENALVSVIIEKKGKYGAGVATLKSILQNEQGTQFIAMMGLYEQEIPIEFSQATLKEAKEIKNVPEVGTREDLTNIDFVTIDGEDAKDFDDAVFAEKDKSGKADWYLAVAIADVSHYVTEGSAIDIDAKNRGNSVYLPSIVVPMLPEELSNELCSLKPKQNRATLTAHMWINNNGELIDYKFKRSIIKSKARLTYTQVQAAIEDDLDSITKPIINNIKNLYDCWKILNKAREKRHALNLESTERKALLNENNEIIDIIVAPVYESHKIIEEFMVLANVASALFLKKHSAKCMYRIHPAPSGEKLENFKQFLKSIDEKTPNAETINNQYFNKLLSKFSNNQLNSVINDVILRTQSQAVYSPTNIGHFGLALKDYAHFTSPIRRYSDLLVHRSIVSVIEKTPEPQDNFKNVGEYISFTERRAMICERTTMNRLVANWLESRIGSVFDAVVSTVNKNGIYVRINENGAEGFVPFRFLGSRRLQFNSKTGTINNGKNAVYKLGMPLRVSLIEAHILSGKLTFNLSLSTSLKSKEKTI